MPCLGSALLPFLGLFLQAAPAPATSPPVQFVITDSALKKHTSVVNNELTITAGAKEPYLSSVPVTDFEMMGEIQLGGDADAALLLYAWEPEIAHEAAARLALTKSARIGELSGTGVHAPRNAGTAAAFLVRSGWQWIRVSCIRRHVRVSVTDGLLTEGDLPAAQYGRLAIDVTKGSISIRNWQFLRMGQPASRPLRDDNPDVGDADPDTPGITLPKLRHEVRPTYTPNAMRGKIQGHTELEAIVEADGSVGPVRITKSLDRELDIEALRAVRQWGFTPALMNRQPVRCRVTVKLDFRLK